MPACNTLEQTLLFAGKFDTSGLTAIMGQRLAIVRWLYVRDAMKLPVESCKNPRSMKYGKEEERGKVLLAFS